MKTNDGKVFVSMALFYDEPSCLGLRIEWLDCCQQHEQSEQENDTHLEISLLHDKELAKLSKGFVPENTSNSTTWALQNFMAWGKSRNS